MRFEKSLDGDVGGDEEHEDEDSGRRRSARVEAGRPTSSQLLSRTTDYSDKWMFKITFLFVFIICAAAKTTVTRIRDEKYTNVDFHVGGRGWLPCDLEPGNITNENVYMTQCGIVHSVKWYRESFRILLYSIGPNHKEPLEGDFVDVYENRTYWITSPYNNSVSYLVIENLTSYDENTFKCEVTYTKVNEGCTVVQFVNVTMYLEPEYVHVGVLAEPDDPLMHTYINASSDFYDYEDSDQTFGVMKKITPGTIVGPVDEGKNISLVCRSGRSRPMADIVWRHRDQDVNDSDLVNYQYREVVDENLSRGFENYDLYPNTGIWVTQSTLTVVGKRGSNGLYECHVKTAWESSKPQISYIKVSVNVSPYSLEMSTSSSGSKVAKVSKVDDRQKSDQGEFVDDDVYAEVMEGEPLEIQCTARGARPKANVTWYYYYKDQVDDDQNDVGFVNDLQLHAPHVQSSKSLKHGTPVVLGDDQIYGSLTEQRRMEDGTEIIGQVKISQRIEYQTDDTYETESKIILPYLHIQQDGSIVRCDAFNNVGSSSYEPLTVNMTIRVKYKPTVWVVPITDEENSGAIVEDEIGEQRKEEIDNNNYSNPSVINDTSRNTNNVVRYQVNSYTVVVNETKELRLQCAYQAYPDKLRTPVKWYRDGIELQLVDEDESSSPSYEMSTQTPSNSAKYARVKGLFNGTESIYGVNNGVDATVLVVRRLTRFDSGQYECRVRNSVGSANSTNFANVRVQYAPKVRLYVILDNSHDKNSSTTTGSTARTYTMNDSTPVILELDHRSVTLRCDVELEPDQQQMKDPNVDPSLNLSAVFWHWDGVKMPLPNCTKLPDTGNDIPEDENEDGVKDIEKLVRKGKKGMNRRNYFKSETHEDDDYVSLDSDNDNDTEMPNKIPRKVVCTEREIVLVNVTKNLHGNYSCQARNAAGLLTKMSNLAPVIIYFAPGPVTLEFYPKLVIKGMNITMRCNVQYLGRPRNPTRYTWYRDGHVFHHPNQDVSNPIWMVDHVSLETRANFSCSAANAGGITTSEPVYIDVRAPPNYINAPPQYLGVAYDSTYVNVSCTVECYPECSVFWLKQGVPIDPFSNPVDEERYSIVTETLMPERLKNDFEAVRSTLIWRMDNWPGRQGLDPTTDSTVYSCRSSDNAVGPPVPESIMHFSVEYPPGNITVSKTVVHVNEGNIPEKVFCNAEGRPLPIYEWRYISVTNRWKVPPDSFQYVPSPAQLKLFSLGTGGGSGGNGAVIGNKEQLVLNSAMNRNQAGYYACVARNSHGNVTAFTFIDVMYKPSCNLKMLTVAQFKQETANSISKSTAEFDEFLSSATDEKRLLWCKSTANPSQVQYTWTIRDSGHQNDTSSSLTTDSLATEKVFTVTIGPPDNNDSPTEVDRVESVTWSILVLEDELEVTNNDDTPNNGETEGVRTYMCTVNNTVGLDQCSIQVQGDPPWWKQLLMKMGLGGWPITIVLVLFIVLLLFIVIGIIGYVIFLIFCKNRYNKSGNGATGGRQKYPRGVGGEEEDDESGSGPLGVIKKRFYENLPFHGMRPPPNQPYKPPVGNVDDDELEYADVDYRNIYYGPINYKQSS